MQPPSGRNWQLIGIIVNLNKTLFIIVMWTRDRIPAILFSLELTNRPNKLGCLAIESLTLIGPIYKLQRVMCNIPNNNFTEYMFGLIHA
jgi:hypothetical protein